MTTADARTATGTTTGTASGADTTTSSAADTDVEDAKRAAQSRAASDGNGAGDAGEPLVLEASGREVVARDPYGIRGPVLHDSFTLARVFAGTPAQVFAHFAEVERWRRWFRLPGEDATYHHDFRVGGGERASSSFALPSMDPESEAVHVERLAFQSHIIAIAPERRIVSSYTATVDDIPRWTSLVTIELEPQQVGTGVDAARTLLRWTEQVAFLAPSDDAGTGAGIGSDDLAHVRGGVALQMNALAAALAQDGAS